MKSTENFYTKFFASIVQNYGTFVPCTNSASSILILTKLCMVLINVRQHKKEEYAVSAAIARNITKRERVGLQYLGGFILRNTHSTMQKSMNAENMDKMKLSMLAVKTRESRKISNLSQPWIGTVCGIPPKTLRTSWSRHLL